MKRLQYPARSRALFKTSLLGCLGASMLLAGQGAFAQQVARTDARVIPPNYFGMHFHRIGDTTAWPSARIGTWRLWDADVNWWNLEPERGKWDFSRLDNYVAAASQRNVQVILPLAAPPTWASARPTEASPYNPGAAAEPADMRDWQNYVRTVAARYKGRILHYELWNEANEKNHYSGSVETLVTLGLEARKVLKEVDPNIQLVGPSVVGHRTEMSYLDSFLAKGGADAIDIVAYHFYVTADTPEAMVPLAGKIRAVMARNGVTKPLWNTETGWTIDNTDGTAPTVTDPWWKRLNQEQAAGYVIRSFALGWALGLDRFVWYAWDNHDMGFIEPRAGKPKLAGAAFANAVTLLGGSQISDCAPSGAVWTCNMVTAGGKQARLMWSATDKDIAVSLPADWTTNTELYLPERSVAGYRYSLPQITVGAIPRLLVKK